MKIVSLELIDNPKVGNLKIDFTVNSRVQDTIILAGNNGCGKTTILEEIVAILNVKESINLERYSGKIIAIYEVNCEEKNTIIHNIKEKNDDINEIKNFIDIINNMKLLKIEIDFSKKIRNFERVKAFGIYNNNEYEINKYNIVLEGDIDKVLSCFYSTANLNYNLRSILNITTIDLDEKTKNIITDSDIGTIVKQTFVDIYNLDAQDFQKWASENIGKTIDESKMYQRIKRFSNAFNYIIDSIRFDKIENNEGKKEVIFKNIKGDKIKIDDLSTGEKQIIIRGGYLLRFLKSLQGNIILIDEPELSLHPEWQKRILQFYKKLFTDDNGKQTSQIFIATHSPFIIHNSSRYNDKVIVLNKDNEGIINILKDPKYYECNNNMAIKDAFNIDDFNNKRKILFTEGETDKKYIDTAIKIFFDKKLDFDVEWIGAYNTKGNPINTGCTGLDNLLKVIETNKFLFPKKIGLLYDCDTNKQNYNSDNYFVYTLKQQESEKYKIGIENLLSLPPDFEYKKFISTTTKTDKYGVISTISGLEKNKLCDYICSSPKCAEYLSKFEDIIKDIITYMD